MHSARLLAPSRSVLSLEICHYLAVGLLLLQEELSSISKHPFTYPTHSLSTLPNRAPYHFLTLTFLPSQLKPPFHPRSPLSPSPVNPQTVMCIIPVLTFIVHCSRRPFLTAQTSAGCYDVLLKSQVPSNGQTYDWSTTGISAMLLCQSTTKFPAG